MEFLQIKKDPKLNRKIKNLFDKYKKKHNFKKIGIYSGFVALGLLVVIFTQVVNNQKKEFNIEGSVLPSTTENLPVSVDFLPINQESLIIGQTVNLDLGINTSGESINGVQLFFDVNTNTTGSLEIISAPDSGMKIVKSEVIPNENGFSVKLISLPETIATSVSTTQYKKIASIQFIPDSNGTINIIFDHSKSKSVLNNVEPIANALANTPSKTFSILDPLASPNPSPTIINKEISALEDAHVKSGSPTSNYGNQTTLEIDGSPTYVAYLKYDLNEFIGNTITRAKLRMTITNSSSSTQNIKAVADNNWSQDTITYNNSPSLGSIIANTSNNIQGNTIDIDITDYIKQNNGEIVTIGIDSSGGDGLDIVSKEGGTNSVKLVITYDSNPSPTQSPTPSPSPTPSLLPSPSPSPSPSVSNSTPEISTSRLSSGRKSSSYSSSIVSTDKDLNDTVLMSIEGLPGGLSLNNCNTKVNRKKNYLETKCSLSGIPTGKGTYYPIITVVDDKGAQSSKSFTLKIR